MSGKRYRILLLEDNPYDAELTIHLISELSIDTEVVLCKTGKEFEEKLQPFAPHVVISDYDLPHYTGGKALTHLQSIDGNRLVPFILVSGVVPLERASEMMQMGMFDMIDKSNLQSLGPALLRAVQVADERKAAHKQAELLRKVGAISRIGGWELDLRTNVLTWTEITKEIHEVPKDYQPKLETATEFFKEGWSRDLIEKCVREGVEDGKSYDVELILVTAKGNERWVRTMGEAEFRDGECIRLFGVIQDLDEQIRARKEKETVAERHRAVLEAAKAVTWDWHIPTNRVYVDSNFVELAVPTRIAVDMQMQEDAHGTYISIEDIAQLIHPDHRDDFQQKMMAHLGGLTPVFEVEYQAYGREDNVLWVYNRGGVVEYDESGNPQRMIGSIVDVTQEVTLRNELSEQAALIKAVTENINGVISRYLVYPDGTSVASYISRGSEKLYGISPEDATENVSLLFERIHPEDLQAVVDGITECGRSLKTFTYTFRASHLDGTEKWLKNTAIPTKQEDGSILWDGITVDVTEQVRLREDYRKQHQLIEGIANNVNGAIYRYALYPNGKDQVLYLNKGAEEFFGLALDKAKMRARLLFERIHPEDVNHLMEQIKDAVENLHPLSNIFRLQSEDGTYRWIKNTALVQKQEDGTIIWDGFTVDVTDQVRLREDYRKQHQLIEGIANNVNGAIGRYRLDTSGKNTVEFVSKGVEELYGVSLQSVYDDLGNLFKMIHKDDLEVILKDATVLTEPHRTFHHVFRATDASGKLKWLELFATGTKLSEDVTVWDSITLDITKQAESKKNFETIFNFSPIAKLIFRIDDGRIVQVNKKAAKIYGYSEQELVGMHVSQLRKKGKAQTNLKHIIEQIRKGEKQHDFYATHIRKDSTEIQIRADGDLITIDGADCIIAAIRDITEELKQKDRLEKLSLVAEHSTNGVVIISNKGIVEWANDAFARITGYELDEIRGEHVRFLAEHNHTDKKDAEALLKSMKDGEPSYIESLNRTKDGKEYWVEIFQSPIKDKAGNITNFVGIGNDITNRKRREQELEESRKQTEAALHELEQRNKAVDQHSIVAITDTHGVIQYVNDKFCETSGYTREELVGNTHRLISSGYHNSEFWDKMYATITKGKVWHGVVRNRAKDGTLYWLRTTITPFTDSETDKIERYVAIRTDITPRIEAEAKLRNTLDNLEQLVQQKTEKLEVAHESLLNSMQYAQRLQQAIIPSEEELKKVVSNAGVILRPRDIVSGDFYWFYQFEDELIFALVDCTGHGVPGAMMSMLANELLNSIITQKHIFRPDVVLEELDSMLVEQLMRQDASIRMADGMDMSVVSIDWRNGLFSYAGAKSHGIYYHAKEDRFTQLKPDRHSIGGVIDGVIKDFDRVRFDFDPGDRLYLFSDGIYDQFGGPKAKKFTRQRLFNIIQESKHMAIDKQVDHIDDKLLEWMGGGVQIDDISFVRIEI